MAISLSRIELNIYPVYYINNFSSLLLLLGAQNDVGEQASEHLGCVGVGLGNDDVLTSGHGSREIELVGEGHVAASEDGALQANLRDQRAQVEAVLVDAIEAKLDHNVNVRALGNVGESGNVSRDGDGGTRSGEGRLQGQIGDVEELGAASFTVGEVGVTRNGDLGGGGRGGDKRLLLDHLVQEGEKAESLSGGCEGRQSEELHIVVISIGSTTSYILLFSRVRGFMKMFKFVKTSTFFTAIYTPFPLQTTLTIELHSSLLRILFSVPL